MSIDQIDRAALTDHLRSLGADGWLIFDFHGLNPVAPRVLGIDGMATRRLFVYLPLEGPPTAVAHKIELQPLAGFPGEILEYARWEELHQALGEVVKGRTVAMEIFPEDGVPYLDRVPSGVVELVRKLGGTVVPSAPLVTRFAACWQPHEVSDHRFAAEAIAAIAREALASAVERAGSGLREAELQGEVVSAMEGRGLDLDTLPIVGAGANAANPHYEPRAGTDAAIERDQVLLLDLWGGRSLQTVFADQTWMAYTGKNPPGKVVEVWDTVRRARDAAIEFVRRAVEGGDSLAGFQVDRAARDVIEAAGYGEYFVHRTGHSIDRDLHGSGPHMDDYETRDERSLMPGVGFSIEPGIYLPGDFGVRSEINMYWSADGAVVTPNEPQERLITSV